jgi:hypothetical protein
LFELGLLEVMVIVTGDWEQGQPGMLIETD